MTNRKYMPTFAELIDRLSISQLKEIFISEHREEYTKEITDILHDIDLILEEEKPKITAKTLLAVMNVGIYNRLIWENESNFRKGIKEGNNLELTHSLNGVRNRAKNIIQEILGGRKDYKVDCLAAEHSSYEPSWGSGEPHPIHRKCPFCNSSHKIWEADKRVWEDCPYCVFLTKKEGEL